MDEDTKKVIEASEEAIEVLENLIHSVKRKRTFKLIVAVLCLFGVYACAYYSMWFWMGMCIGISAYSYVSFNSKQTDDKIEEMERLLENAKFNESYLRACVIEDAEGESWK